MDMPIDVQEVVGRNVARFRRDSGLTQTQLGEAMERYVANGWSKQIVSFVERGKRQLDPNELLMLAMCLHKRVYELFMPDEGDEIKVGAWHVPVGEVRLAVAGDPNTTPVVVTLAAQLEELAAQAEFVADQARQVANIIHRKPKTKAKGRKR
jgi:transcriptional regulator with XRE-family HTH domain